jgi:hypothetical protein
MPTLGKLVALMIAILLLTSLAGFADAQNYVTIDQPPNTKSIEIEVTSPVSNQVYNSTNVSVAFHVSIKGTRGYTLYNVTFWASWMAENITIFKQNSFHPIFPDYIDYNNTFSKVPEGNQTIQIIAHGSGSFADTEQPTINGTEYFFKTSSNCMVIFTVANAPEISVVSPLNGSSVSSDVHLNFTLSKEVSWLAYSLDGAQNLTINGNTTINNLASGNHSLTIYAKDSYGNVDSQTVRFAVLLPVSFPFTSISVIIIIAVFAAFILVYLLYKRHKTPTAEKTLKTIKKK